MKNNIKYKLELMIREKIIYILSENQNKISVELKCDNHMDLIRPSSSPFFDSG